MSQPSQQPDHDPMQQNETNQPGEISIFELINSPLQISEQMAQSSPNEDDADMREINLSTVRSDQFQPEFNSSLEPGEINSIGFDNSPFPLQRYSQTCEINTKSSPEVWNQDLQHTPIVEEPCDESIHENQAVSPMEEENLDETNQEPIIEEITTSLPPDHYNNEQSSTMLPSYIVPNNYFLEGSALNPPQNQTQMVSQPGPVQIVSIFDRQQSVLLEPPVKTIKNCFEDTPEIKLHSKSQDPPNAKEQMPYNEGNSSHETQKIEYSSQQAFSNFLISKEDPLCTFNMYKIESQKSSPLSQKSFSEQMQNSDKILKEFKNQAYEVRNKYFEEESQTYKKYILNMRKTLQRQYEKCRLRSSEIFYHNLRQLSIVDLNEKDFCIVVKKEKMYERKGDLDEEKQHQLGPMGESSEKEQLERWPQSSEKEQGELSFKVSKQLWGEFENLKREKMENSSWKFRCYLRKIMVQMSNLIDMSEQVEMVLKMGYKELMGFYTSVVGVRNVIQYEDFSVDEVDEGNEALQETRRISAIEQSSKEQNIYGIQSEEPVNNCREVTIIEDSQFESKKKDRQKLTEESGYFQKQVYGISIASQVKISEQTPQYLSEDIENQSKKMNQLIEGDVQAQAKEAEMKHIIDLLEELEHDEETPVFGVPVGAQGAAKKAEAPPVQETEKTNNTQESVAMVSPLPIDVEKPEQIQQEPQFSPVPAIQYIIQSCPVPAAQSLANFSAIPIAQPLAQQSIAQAVQTIIAQQKLQSSQVKPQKAQIIIESQEQQIIVPKKVPEQSAKVPEQSAKVPQQAAKVPQQGSKLLQAAAVEKIVDTNKLNVESIRKLLLEADSDWTELIQNASDAEILHIYEDLANKFESSNFEHPQTQNLQPIIVEDPTPAQQPPIAQKAQQLPIAQTAQQLSITLTAQQPPIAQSAQQPHITQTTHYEPMEQQPQNIQQVTIIQEQSSSIPTPAQQAIATGQSLSQNPASDMQEAEYEEFELITAALFQSSPELKQQLMQLSKEDLRALYKQTMEENKQKEQTKAKNKKKKVSQPIIDLEEQEPPLMSNDENHIQAQPPCISQSQQQQQIPPQPSYSFLAQYYKRKSEQKPTQLSNPLSQVYVNKTLLYQFIKSNDYQNKLKSILMPKESVKYQQKTQKEIALLYLTELKKNNTVKGPFDAANTQQQQIVVLCKNKSNIKNENLKKNAREGLCVKTDAGLSEEKKRRIWELRQECILGKSALASGAEQLPAQVQNIEPLPNGLPISSNAAWPSGANGQIWQKPMRRYCLIVQEELDAREEQEIGLQGGKKRVKKSSGAEEEEELLRVLKKMIEVEK